MKTEPRSARRVSQTSTRDQLLEAGSALRNSKLEWKTVRKFVLNPLWILPTLKLRIGAVIFTAVSITVFVFWVGIRLGLFPSISGIIAAIVALGFTRVLARGTVTPLRDLTIAAENLSDGDFDQRVNIPNTRDELGILGDAFNAMAAELSIQDRMRKDLVANVSHELRTPITALQAKLENMIDGVEQADPETLETMLSQVERLGRLVTQLLDLSRLESGAVPLDIQDFPVEPLLEHAARETRLQASEMNLDVKVEQGLIAHGDPERVHQVISNLLQNAVRHSPAKGTISVLASLNSDGGVSIEVLDEGPGIPESESPKIFERFYRADAARSLRNGGAGLGLSIARWIVDMHGGEIHPETREPRGCRMVFTLPRR